MEQTEQPPETAPETAPETPQGRDPNLPRKANNRGSRHNYPGAYTKMAITRKAQRPRKRGRPRKPGPRRKYRDHPDRPIPSRRQGARFKPVMLPEEAYLKVKEMSLFYKKSMAQVVASLVGPAFDKAYEESLTLARIEANKEKANAIQTAAQDPDKPARRTHF